MKTNKMKRLSIVSFVLTLLLTGGIFAYWADSVLGSQADKTTAITIGAGQAVTTTVSLEEISKTEGKLVPAGYAVNSDETEEILIKFGVLLLANETGAAGAEATLIVTVLETGHTLINAEVLEHETKIVAGGSETEVTIKITLTEPADIVEYEQVAEKDFDIKIQFEAII